MDTTRFRTAVGLWWRSRPGRWYVFVAMPVAVLLIVALILTFLAVPTVPWLDRARDALALILLALIAVSWIEMGVGAWRAAAASTIPPPWHEESGEGPERS